MVIIHSGTPLAFTRAKRLRQPQTSAEKIIWRKLRAKRFHGIKFRRQVPIGIYIVDFLCMEMKLVVEIDGESHGKKGAKEYDAHRTAYLESRGLRVIRFSNDAVRTNMEWVLTELYEAISFKPLPGPLLKERETSS